jgi:hypothetical protein
MNIFQIIKRKQLTCKCLQYFPREGITSRVRVMGHVSLNLKTFSTHKTSSSSFFIGDINDKTTQKDIKLELDSV